MIFSNLVFLFLFLPALLILYYISKDKFKNYVLLLFSLIFYAWGEPKYVFLMIASIVINYILGIKISHNSKARKLWFAFSIIFNLGILIIFKYTNFIIDTINSAIGVSINIPQIALPLGISFFTFQMVSYIIDVYRRDTEVQESIVNLALYISLFPQLIAGPIVRYQTVDKQINNREHSMNKFAVGVNRFIVGLAKKVIFANQLGLIADGVFNAQVLELSTLEAWLGLICYSLQIYFDFSGYSDMAIGLGKMFGFDFLENFNYPYISQSVSEFWRRWHISLGSWFRDYVYIPLGGNRVNQIRHCVNLLIVWSLTGIWHGANWNFLIWGLYYGIFIIIEKLFLGELLNKLPRMLRHIYLLLIVTIGMVFFRAESISQAKGFIQALMGINTILYNNSILEYMHDLGYVVVLSILFATPIIPKIKSIIETKNERILESNQVCCLHSVGLMSLMLVEVVMIINSTYNPFLYFRF
ncbi:MBOAT family protein [Schnuerera sp. xch1]|uniref:MBOAT family O-acyltransferase n=1 Tax=Schnuerera sp. xch1 TaxID=2874283 RepID=UPI001CC00C39|nr:MBOAT family O-acyltransferase [Schnuerera sp. xch1]MBZ2174267.1 MBOAT family protein [Schnuerera sp. xch1]